MAIVTICSDLGAQKNKVSHCFHCFPIYLPWSDGTGYHDLSFTCPEIQHHVGDLQGLRYSHWSVDAGAVQIRENKSWCGAQPYGPVTPGRFSQRLCPSVWHQVYGKCCLGYIRTQGTKAHNYLSPGGVTEAPNSCLSLWRDHLNSHFYRKSLHAFFPHSGGLALGVWPGLISRSCLWGD